MRTPYPLTLIAPILDDTMTVRDVEAEAKAALLPTLDGMGLELARLDRIEVVERGDQLHVAITIDVIAPGCAQCDQPIGYGRRTLCGSPECVRANEKAKRKRYQAPRARTLPTGQYECQSTAQRRDQVAALTRQGMSVKEIALRLLGNDGPTQMRAISRDRVKLRARAS